MTAAASPELVELLLRPMLDSAVELVRCGDATAADVDLAMRLGARHARGPLEVLGLHDAADDSPPTAPFEGDDRRDAPAGVVGSGFMATGIAYAIAVSGQDVVLLGRTTAAAEAGAARISADLDAAVARGRIDPDAAAAARARVTAATDYDALAGTGLVIEAVSEDIAIKQDVFARLDDALPPATWLATNTSSFRVGDIGSRTRNPERVIGLHYFSPAPAMKLVEVVGTVAVPGPQLEAAEAWVRASGKVPVRCNDRPGFIVNWLLIPFINDAIRAHGDGVAPIEVIDEQLKEHAGHPMGPFELIDLIGIDVTLAAQRSLFEQTGEPRLRPAHLMEELVEQGRLGRKSGEGFYSYQ